MEIERKFLIDLDSLPLVLKDHPWCVIEQGYLAVDKAHAREVRLRKRAMLFRLGSYLPSWMFTADATAGWRSLR